MIELITEKQRSGAVRRLSFCYLCGEPLGRKRGVGWNPDHVPPTSCLSGRGAALHVRAHPACNESWSHRDEVFGQLIATMLRRVPAPENTKIDVKFINGATGEPFSGVREFDMERDIRRMVCAFHAALYGEYLAADGIAISLPFSAGRLTDTGPVAEPLPRWHSAAVVDVLHARGMNCIDRIVCDGGECEYVCTWLPSQRRCVFALRLHVWGQFGDARFGQRGCVGTYVREAIPSGAAIAPTIAVPVRIPNPLDVFAA